MEYLVDHVQPRISISTQNETKLSVEEKNVVVSGEFCEQEGWTRTKDKKFSLRLRSSNRLSTRCACFVGPRKSVKSAWFFAVDQPIKCEFFDKLYPFFCFFLICLSLAFLRQCHVTHLIRYKQRKS